MTKTVFYIKDYIQPFERELALRELTAVCGAEAVPVDGPADTASIFRVPGAPRNACEALAYWEAAGTRRAYTTQVRREATANVARNGVLLETIPALTSTALLAKIPRKRVLRYGTHGIHEYRGKFFPQLVKSLINISGIPPGGIVLDPMCGSGTTLVEASLAGHSAVGIDMNPLSVLVSRVKCEALSLGSDELVNAYGTIARRLQAGEPPRLRIREGKDEKYLDDWFCPTVRYELDQISDAIDCLPTLLLREFFSVSMSNILRSVSHQKDDDLRVRRDDKIIAPGQAIDSFLDEAIRSAKSLVAFLSHGSVMGVGEVAVHEGDARAFVPSLVEPGSVDLVITSPPYATALPYLDTDRLSLIYLGLLPRANHRGRDSSMIGNREVTERSRRTMWATYLEQRATLPDAITSLVDLIDRENSTADVGFRRKNLAALLAHYFTDMRGVLRETLTALKPGGSAFFVVGNNRTTLRSGDLEIRTADLLCDLATAVGFHEVTRIEMEMLVSRDLFRKNQTPSEHILRFTKSEVPEALL